MILNLIIALTFSFSASAMLRVTVPDESQLGGFTKREGELYSLDDNQTLVMQSAAGPVVINEPYETKIAIITDVKSAGTTGGTFTTGAWGTRDLNTLSDPYELVTSLSSNQFTLPAGTYHVEAWAPAMSVETHKARLRNITDSSDTIIGQTAYSRYAHYVTSFGHVDGVVEITSPKTFELQHICSYTRTSDGFGPAHDFGVPEVFSQIRITKLK